jgi:preprotein translocase subunit SecY
MNKLISIFKIPELTRKIVITIILLSVYRIGYYIPVPFIDQQKLAERMEASQSGALGQVLGFVSMFSGGNLTQSSIIALGIMPYISSSIIFQLLASFYPPLEKLQKEGESGRKKINEYTRYATVPICLFQAGIVVKNLVESDSGGRGGWGLAMPGFDEGFNLYFYSITAILTMTAGTIFLMWLGEQIDEYGIGNGISLIIMAGIVGRIPAATTGLLLDRSKAPFAISEWIPSLQGSWLDFHLPRLKESLFTLGGGASASDIGFEKLLVLIFLFIAVVIAVIAMTKAQRRIPMQSAKHVRGRRVYGGTRNYLPLKVNQAGVMPVIFASSLLMVPRFVFMGLSGYFTWAQTLLGAFDRQGWLYLICYIGMIYFFCYFWTAIVFNPKEMANNLKDHGSFIPGYRPGKSTADYLEKVMMRITFVGAAFLAIIAIIPNLISTEMSVDYQVASFYGGTGLLIVISVALDLVQKINSHLVMRNYPGLTED